MDNPKNDAPTRPVELVSDFSDYYDRQLVNGDGKSYLRYLRYSDSTLSRQEVFTLLMAKNFPVPTHGLVQHMARKIDLLAVYTDDTGHPRGERCAVMPHSDALAERPDSFAVEYKGEIGSPSISYRDIHIGKRGWKLRYRSSHPWASNQEDAEIVVVSQLDEGWDERFSMPIYALDYIDLHDSSGWWSGHRLNTRYYFDFQPHPKIEDTPITKKLSPKKAADLIREALTRYYILRSQPKKELTNPRPASYTKVSDYE